MQDKIRKTRRLSPNFNERANGRLPDMIVIHYTSMKSTEAALDRLCDDTIKKKVSCHYLIDEDGLIYEMVDEKKRAWHAGISFWAGRRDINQYSIGIELSNRGHEPFPDAQIRALIALCKDLIKRYDIEPDRIVGHSDIAPDRKPDPGPLFPWAHLACEGVGIFPAPRKNDWNDAVRIAKSPNKLRELFKKAGYPVHEFDTDRPTLGELVYAFQSRYLPHVVHANGGGKADARTVARLRAVARAHRHLRKARVKRRREAMKAKKQAGKRNK